MAAAAAAVAGVVVTTEAVAEAIILFSASWLQKLCSAPLIDLPHCWLDALVASAFEYSSAKYYPVSMVARRDITMSSGGVDRRRWQLL